jgi:hypothetical protein
MTYEKGSRFAFWCTGEEGFSLLDQKACCAEQVWNETEGVIWFIHLIVDVQCRVFV